MLWKKSLLSTSQLSGLALGVCALSLSGASAFAQDTMQMQYTGPSQTEIKGLGIKTAVVAATDTGGDKDIALRALKAATIALGRTQGYLVMPASEVAKSLQSSNLRWPFVPRQYPEVKKKLGKADRVVSVSVSPVAGTPDTYSALVEMFDTNNGGLVGRGEGTYTATADSRSLLGSANTTTVVSASTPVLGSFPVPAGTVVADAPDGSTPVTTVSTSSGTDIRFLAVDGAILRALGQMNEPAAIDGVVVSLPGGYLARLSKGEMHGLRNGARIEYTVGGRTIAYGTAVDVGKGETLATVAPERAFPLLEINGEFRSINNPPRGSAGKTREEFDAAEWNKFEKQFGLAAGVAAVGYLIYTAID